MIHKGFLSKHPYNICSKAGFYLGVNCFTDTKQRWVHCQYPILGILEETEKAKLIKLNESLAVWVPNKVIHKIDNNILYWTPLIDYHFGGANDEFFVKLEQEVNSMQIIKVGDLVYAPNYSHKVLPVLKCPNSDNLYVTFNIPGGSTNHLYFNKFGKVVDQLQPVVFLATEDNKQKVEAFYNITLEDVPENQFLAVFETLLESFKKEAVDAFDYGSEDLSGLENIRNHLIQMFKDRL